MAKERRTNSTVNSIQTLLGAIDKVAEAEFGDLSPEQQAEANKVGLEAVKKATKTIADSNVITSAEYQDENIEARITAEEAAEAAEEENEAPEETEDGVSF